MASLITIFREMPDPRRGNGQRHDLPDILTIALVASVCGAESGVDFAEFAQDREPLLRDFPSLENGLPGHDTFSRVFFLRDPVAFGRAFEAFLADLGADGPGTRHRRQNAAALLRPRGSRSPLNVVTAFGAEARVSVGSRAVAPGETESTAARALRATLTLDGALVTGDPIHAKAETAGRVPDRGATGSSR